MGAGLGVLARLTQQVNQNRVQEQNFRSGLAQQARAEITENRRIRIQEQSDLAARDDRDLDRAQRDEFEANRIDLENRKIAAANERARIAAASRAARSAGGDKPGDEVLGAGIGEAAVSNAPVIQDGSNPSRSVDAGDIAANLPQENRPRTLEENEALDKEIARVRGTAASIRVLNEKELLAGQAKLQPNKAQNILDRNKARELKATQIDTQANVMDKTLRWEAPPQQKPPSTAELAKIDEFDLTIKRKKQDKAEPSSIVVGPNGSAMQLRDLEALVEGMKNRLTQPTITPTTTSSTPPAVKNAGDIRLDGTTSGKAAISVLK